MAKKKSSQSQDGVLIELPNGKTLEVTYNHIFNVITPDGKREKRLAFELLNEPDLQIDDFDYQGEFEIPPEVYRPGFARADKIYANSLDELFMSPSGKKKPSKIMMAESSDIPVVTAFSYYLIMGLKEEFISEGIITREGAESQLERIIFDRDHEDRSKVDRIVLQAIDEAGFQYQLEKGKIPLGMDIFENPKTIKEGVAARSWVRGDVMRANEWAVFEALTNFNPNKEGYESEFGDKRIKSVDWSAFESYVSGSRFATAWGYLVKTHRNVTNGLKQLQGVKTKIKDSEPGGSGGSSPGNEGSIQISKVIGYLKELGVHGTEMEYLKPVNVTEGKINPQKSYERAGVTKRNQPDKGLPNPADSLYLAHILWQEMELSCNELLFKKSVVTHDDLTSMNPGIAKFLIGMGVFKFLSEAYSSLVIYSINYRDNKDNVQIGEQGFVSKIYQALATAPTELDELFRKNLAARLEKEYSAAVSQKWTLGHKHYKRLHDMISNCQGFSQANSLIEKYNTQIFPSTYRALELVGIISATYQYLEDADVSAGVMRTIRSTNISEGMKNAYAQARQAAVKADFENEKNLMSPEEFISVRKEHLKLYHLLRKVYDDRFDFLRDGDKKI